MVEQPKSFIELLEVVGIYDINSVNKTINILAQKSIPVNTENIKMILNRNNDIKENSMIKSDMQKQIEEISKRHLSMYDKIIGTTGIQGGVAV